MKHEEKPFVLGVLRQLTMLSFIPIYHLKYFLLDFHDFTLNLTSYINPFSAYNHTNKITGWSHDL